MAKRTSGCPLCGAGMTAMELLDGCSELIDAHLGVLSARCPHCQGYLEVRPAAGQVDIGYTVGTGNTRFDVALSLPYEGLVIEHSENPPSLTLKAPGRHWAFRE